MDALSQPGRILILSLILVLLDSEPSGAQGEADKSFTLQLSNGTYVVHGRSITLQEGNGTDTVAMFSELTVPMLLHYRPYVTSHFGYDTTKERFDQVVELDHTEASAAFAYQNEIWVGFGYYEGEGSEGVGGIGFYDSRTRELGVLRHPSLVDCSVSELLVTANTIYVKTAEWHEGEVTYGNGIVVIDRRTLEATSRVPPGSPTIWGGEENEEDYPPGKNPRYDRPISELLAASHLISQTIPQWPEKTRKEIQTLGPRRFMIQAAESERRFK